VITWDELVYNLTELCKLENGGGAEIEFEYAGAEYIIICYKDWCSLAAIKDNGGNQPGPEKKYGSLDELGAAQDFGFRLHDVWDQVQYLECRPDFDSFYLQEILDAYREAWNERNRGRASQNGVK